MGTCHHVATRVAVTSNEDVYMPSRGLAGGGRDDVMSTLGQVHGVEPWLIMEPMIDPEISAAFDRSTKRLSLATDLLLISIGFALGIAVALIAL